MGNVSLNVLEKSLNFLFKNEYEPCYLDTFFDEYVVSVNGFHPPGGGGGLSAQRRFIPEGSASRSNPLPFFDRKGTLFDYLLLTNGTPFT